MRLSKRMYFLSISRDVSTRATCGRARVGCVLVKQDRIIATGYNGSPSGLPHCDDVGHDIQDGHCVRTIHAELNALLQCAHYGVSTAGATAYVTVLPCIRCAMHLISAGVNEVVCAGKHRALSLEDVERYKVICSANLLKVYVVDPNDVTTHKVDASRLPHNDEFWEWVSHE